MTDWWAHAGNKAKFFVSTLAAIAILGGWFWSVFVIADDAKDALEKIIVLEQTDKALEKKLDDLGVKVDERLDNLETKMEVSDSNQKLRDEYQKAQLNRIEDLLTREPE